VRVAPHKVSLGMAVAALAVTAACGGSGGGSSAASSKPLVIGISLSFSGDFSDPGHAAELGYKLWADQVNAHGILTTQGWLLYTRREKVPGNENQLRPVLVWLDPASGA